VSRACLLLALLAGCGAHSHSHAPAPRPASRPASQPADDGLARVAAIHGGLGPWAVAGYRMGQRALAELGRERGDMTLLVEHRSPAQVQWSCIADGLQASTGASAGRLNLRWEEVTLEQLRSRVVDRESGQALQFTVRESFRQRYLNVPRPQLEAAAREAAELPDDAIFEVTREP
jgi:formylmethanofuran dehydrogenase subunit E